jgi:hypothetical protein
MADFAKLGKTAVDDVNKAVTELEAEGQKWLAKSQKYTTEGDRVLTLKGKKKEKEANALDKKLKDEQKAAQAAIPKLIAGAKTYLPVIRADLSKLDKEVVSLKRIHDGYRRTIAKAVKGLAEALATQEQERVKQALAELEDAGFL